MAQKTIIQICQQVAGELNLPAPQAVLSSQDQNVQKLLNLARAVGDDLVAEYDWQALQTPYQVSTVAGTDNYAFPTDIARFTAFTIWDNSTRWALRGSLTPGQWNTLRHGLIASAPPYSRYRIMANRIYLDPVPSAVHNLTLEYISSYFVRDASTGLPKADFTNDADVCMFDHRIMVYGMKLKFLTSIGQDTTAALSDYGRALEFAKGHDAPRQKLSLIGNQGSGLINTSNYPDGFWNQ